MPFRSALLRSLPLALLAVTLAGCQDDPPPPVADTRTPTSAVESPTVAAAVVRLPEFDKMQAMIERAGLMTGLGDKKGTFTLLLPRDSALAQLAPEVRRALVEGDGGALAPLLKGLIIDRTITAEELRTRIDQGGGSFVLPTQAGHDVTFTRNGAMLIVTTPTGKASMGTEAVMTDNGAIFVLDHWVSPTLAPGATAPATPAAGATSATATPGAATAPAAAETPLPPHLED
jgi:uncharacterized surface protein with fasciclin (FAS1) repeats